MAIGLLAGVVSAASCGAAGRVDDKGWHTPEAELIELFKSEGVLWIRAERDRHRSQDADDRHHDHQFDQRKTALKSCHHSLLATGY